MKKTMLGCMGMVLGLILVSPVNAEFIANGDFGTWESGWGEDNGARFTNSAGNPAWSGVLTVGNSVLWQSLSALPANTQYTISIDGVGYNTNVGGLYVAMIYYHTNGTMTSDAVLTIPSADLPTDWTTYTSSTFQTPTDLSYAKIWIAKLSQVGGWVGVDNVKGTVVPEPATVGLLAIGGLLLRRQKASH
jgi:hypothetical protein